MFDLPRSSGLLLHPTSLPGRFGMGEIGREALRWLESLDACGQRVWQMLPLGPTGFGNSPYQSLSSFAGNPLLISFDALRNDGALLPQDLAMLPGFERSRVDFGPAIEVRGAFLQLAARRFLSQTEHSPLVERAFEVFCDREAEWLDDFALFMALRQEQGEKPWVEWPEPLALREPWAMAEAMVRLAPWIEETKVLQFFFHRQWQRVRLRARQLGITLVGDMPLFPAHDSADVWAHRELFRLDENGHPPVVAGVPPDAFSATGQRWGNPLYQWEAHQQTRFAWWRARLKRTLAMVDLVRLDHFRGLAACWEIPATEETAERGQWVPAPGHALLEAVRQDLGALPIIAEDLGLITEDVVALREAFELPGMRVLQFAFGSEGLSQEHLPSRYPRRSVAYTGTHDNDTSVGFFTQPTDDPEDPSAATIRLQILDTLKTEGREPHWDFIRAVLRSEADLAVVPMQDVLGLDASGRMNRPGQTGNLWNWRFGWEQFSPELQSRLRRETRVADRTGA